MTEKPQPSPWNLPNALTVLRILLVPLFLFLLLGYDGLDPMWRLGAFVVFGLAMLTDKIDGDLARRWDLITDFGKIADPIADKSLMAAALIGLALIGALPWWIPIVILVREFGITVLRLLIVRRVVLPASKGGKLKTLLQTIAIGLFIVLLPLAAVVPDGVTIAVIVIAWVVMTAAVIVTLVTGIDYCIRIARLLREPREPRARA
ncbi:CDP-diacylglycerol--glycerol-3-phosphate 3-phosphatidyltransferase [Brevibacterium sp. R8603A2]|uniref:CDP-diacylglycerol--glycerol-3-phosphate 3-phosphatidyltransferase n=1 Tax=unclassified Brevibacterium TaxID=2614124 RepID=UPI001FFC1F6B|nr:CDP-diacylglycerol--glycerol-3-phosphate 3-phosphatidyltransferase [Brevibacterium sp. R8603A2]MCK1801957.1 CDP-diacylglycerol--glycerol-3-phosphate 3-phosphatidyltransferase [Brevibacterium sp. R8603A2]